MFAENTGYDSIRECFGEYSGYIKAVETGNSSDPSMSWRVSSLDKVSLISNSDARSLSKIGREANFLETELSYEAIWDAINSKDPKKFIFTVEFFPQEGKYYNDGHKDCNVSQGPCVVAEFPRPLKKTKKVKCPKCKKPLTIGVLGRISQLADRAFGFVPEKSIPFKTLIPLQEIIAEVLDKGVDTTSVKNEYAKLISKYGSEFRILIDESLDNLSRGISEDIFTGISRVRSGDVFIEPGYDGQSGKIKLFDAPLLKLETPQISLFG